MRKGEECRVDSSERYVGLFYFLWLGQHGTEGPYDNTKIVSERPEAVHDPNHPAWGPVHAFHFWGEPLYGYYLSDDEWVLRRHVQLLTAAGVDFLVFDTTNSSTYKNVYDKLFRVMDEIRAQGFAVPQFVFYTNTDSGKRVGEIFEDVYKPGRYPHLWFRLDGKPLIIGNPEECSEEQRAFFTFRLNQWPNEAARTNGFPWIEFERPQRVFYNDRGEKEVISVSVAQHPSVAMSDTPFYGYGGNWGRGYSDGADPEEANSLEAIYRGANLAEQWEFALAEDPRIVFVTGWNEWIAMRFDGVPERPVLFVDQATLNFSRDIEPMNGGYNDNYYMQLIEYIRRFKGTAPPVLAGTAATLNLSDGFGGWDGITAEVRDFEGDTMPRSHRGYGDLIYTSDTGRNDFVSMKAAHDDRYIYFYARTREPLSPCTGKHWMMLLINTDGTADKGWHGYDFIVNRSVIDDSTTLLERSTGGWVWERVADIWYVAAGRELQLAVPRAALGLDRPGEPLCFEFKWADHMLSDGDIMDFYRYGDVAPEGRLNYAYREAERR
ncbi:hypothetical protein COLU111180_02650 [Cohnella lubricantis]|uniref:Uncharacterized protein n=1 Tax=Cohnella lubricantis TaxID=2163172 RepID=A0A841T6Q7_9BACL|nr:hypothetical protein [Cohnella lubricantis]MBB6675726.1 hypothetical protein [Cohnella lubricantis]MBP2118870.1 hypothetical protein [Cohnella lubricantis]